MRRVLFVDDEPLVLDGLRRMLYPLRKEWSMAFARSGAEALGILAREEFDVIVADMRMPGMNGSELLAQVVARYPHMVRIVLSGQFDQELMLPSARTAHQYLDKPCDQGTLKATIDRAFALRDLLGAPSLQRVVSAMTTLPSVPATYLELTNRLQSPDASIEDVAKIVSRDPAMVAKILQLVNSSFFGVRKTITSPADAVLYLGLNTLKAVVLSVGVFSGSRLVGCSHLSLEALGEHSYRTAFLAQKIAASQNFPKKDVEEAYTAGLLHDIGKLVMAINFTRKYDALAGAARARRVPLRVLEAEEFGTTHAEVGTYLLWLWGLPGAIAETAAFHHRPAAFESQKSSPLTAVHIANAIECPAGSAGCPDREDIDHEYLASRGLALRLPEWRALAVELRERRERA